MTLTDEQFVQDVDYSHGSVRNQMVHMAVVDKRWLMGLRGEAGAQEFDVDLANYLTRQSAYQLWQDTAKEVQAYLRTLTEDDLISHAPYMPGPIWQVLTHVVNHGTDHRAQILRLLHDLGAPTFDQDLIIHLWMR